MNNDKMVVGKIELSDGRSYPIYCSGDWISKNQAKQEQIKLLEDLILEMHSICCLPNIIPFLRDKNCPSCGEVRTQDEKDTKKGYQDCINIINKKIKEIREMNDGS